MCVITLLLYIWKYWQSLNLAICPKSGRNALLAEFKFGGLLRYVIAWISLYAILTNIIWWFHINMVVSSATAKSPPIFPDLQYLISRDARILHIACTVRTYVLQYVHVCMLDQMCILYVLLSYVHS